MTQSDAYIIVFIVFLIVLFIIYTHCSCKFACNRLTSLVHPQFSLISTRVSSSTSRIRSRRPRALSRPPSYNTALLTANNSEDQLVPSVAIESRMCNVSDGESGSTSDHSPPPYSECIQVPLINQPGVYWGRAPSPPSN